MKKILQKYGLIRAEFESELSAITGWWLKTAFDPKGGGVYGEIADDNTVNKIADKGAVLQTRVLWFLSEATRCQPSSRIEDAAHNMYGFIADAFCDAEHGGYVWSVSADGKWISDRKQTYAQAFAIYALCAYARAFKNDVAQASALRLAERLEDKAWDHRGGGYVEAFVRDWSPIDDWRLSDKDLNAPKTMNTHLHVLEAYTSLHALIGNDFTSAVLRKNVDLFIERFLKPRGDHLSLFYTMDWQDQCADESYGHDIEASWLLYEAAETLGDEALLVDAKAWALKLASAALAAVDEAGGFVYERHADGRGLDARRHWWPQAEALVGFTNAFELSRDEKFLAAAGKVWAFIKAFQIDTEHGEWRWFSSADKTSETSYKIGFWKGPYHNGRAMMEIMRRLET